MVASSALAAPSDNTLMSPRAVVFRGDGEPKSAELMVKGLAEIVDGVGIEGDSYSLGGVVEGGGEADG